MANKVREAARSRASRRLKAEKEGIYWCLYYAHLDAIRAPLDHAWEHKDLDLARSRALRDLRSGWPERYEELHTRALITQMRAQGLSTQGPQLQGTT